MRPGWDTDCQVVDVLGAFVIDGSLPLKSDHEVGVSPCIIIVRLIGSRDKNS